MGLLDKVKAQATAATEMAKDAAAKGQAKMNDVPGQEDGRRHAAGPRRCLLRHQHGRSTPTTETEIEQLVTSLQAARVRARPDHPGARVRSRPR